MELLGVMPGTCRHRSWQCWLSYPDVPPSQQARRARKLPNECPTIVERLFRDTWFGPNSRNNPYVGPNPQHVAKCWPNVGRIRPISGCGPTMVQFGQKTTISDKRSPNYGRHLPVWSNARLYQRLPSPYAATSCLALALRRAARERQTSGKVLGAILRSCCARHPATHAFGASRPCGKSLRLFTTPYFGRFANINEH